MAVVPISTLYGYFLTGNKPNQSNYEDLIETLSQGSTASTTDFFSNIGNTFSTGTGTIG